MTNPSFIHADIFFFVTTIAVALVAAAIVVAAVFAIRILKDVKEITEKAKAEWDEVVTDSRRLRSSLRDEGLKWKHVAGLIRTFFVRDASRPRRKARAAQDTETESRE